MRFVSRVALAGIVAGLLLGVLFPATGEAVQIAYVFNHQGGNGYLTCGWHESGSGCGSGTPYAALDWDNADGGAVYWRSWTVNPLSSSPTLTGSVDPVDATSTCYAVRADLRDPSGNSRGAVAYKHTNNDGYFFYLYGTSAGYWQANNRVGDSVTADKGGCDFRGSHVHQHSGGSFSAHSHSAPNYYPTDSQCDLDGTTTYCGTLADRHTYHYHMLQTNYNVGP